MADTKEVSLEPIADKPKYLRHFEGILIGDLFDESRLRSAFRYEPRDDDVFVVGFPKTGTTWLHFVLQRLMNHASETPAQSAAACVPNVSFLEFAGGEKIESLPRPRAIIKTHLPFENVRFSEQARYIYVLRNPYDTCVSYYHQVRRGVPGCSDISFDDFFEQFMNGWVHPNDYFDHLASWFAQRSRPNFLCITYEQMKRDPHSGILKIAAFLGNEFEREIGNTVALDAIVQAVSPEAMKNAFAEAPLGREQDDSIKRRPSRGASRGQNLSDEPSKQRIKGANLVRKAIVGDWENHFSALQIERMKSKMAAKTAGFRADLEALWKDANLP
ncbi:sulfotransferase 2A8-like [Dermacentor andersoni]|uniref:sulfotransferase 2A8-like n=1 Tax=Dermacentor andersoni TaxID=34620 RepID=UPI002155F8AB|nr:sulfotransferase 2A8-like [Dermacentor andersoni]